MGTSGWGCGEVAGSDANGFIADSRFVEHFLLVSSNAVLLVDYQGQILLANPAAHELFGENLAAVTDIVSNWTDQCPTDLAGKEIVLPGAQSSVTIRLDCFAYTSNDTPCLLFTFVDLTAQRNLEAQLQVKSSAAAAGSDQIFVMDENLDILYVSPELAKEIGYSCAELIGKRPIFLNLEPQVYQQDLADSISISGPWRHEIECTKQSGCRTRKDLSINPVYSGSGELLHYVAVIRDTEANKSYGRKLDHLALHDPLTGLPNRILFRDRLTQALAHAKRTGEGLAVIFLDLDGFKNINDSLGHKVGDKILHAVARRLTRNSREADTVARMSGDEFTMIIQNINNSESAATAAQRVMQSFEQPFKVQGHELYVTASLGIALYPEDGKDAESLVEASDSAMYRAKQSGCNKFQLYTAQMHKAALERIKLTNGLRRAISNQEFVVYYHPKIDIRTGWATGVEALVRWEHPIEGHIPSDIFVPLAEESGLIAAIGEITLRQACGQAAQWIEEKIPIYDVAVNVTARQFARTDLVKTIEEVLGETGLDPKNLSLELTESALIVEPTNTIHTLRRLKNMGIGITIDDFGIGYSSLNYLKQYPIDALKIDRSFIKEITSKPDNTAITGAIISMAHNLCLKVIAEGVETAEQVELLRLMQCDEMQGYYASMPLTGEKCKDYLTNQQRSA